MTRTDGSGDVPGIVRARAALRQAVIEVASIPEPLERARQAQHLNALLDGMLPVACHVRDEAIRVDRDEGGSGNAYQVAAYVGVSGAVAVNARRRTVRRPRYAGAARVLATLTAPVEHTYEED